MRQYFTLFETDSAPLASKRFDRRNEKVPGAFWFFIIWSFIITIQKWLLVLGNGFSKWTKQELDAQRDGAPGLSYNKLNYNPWKQTEALLQLITSKVYSRSLLINEPNFYMTPSNYWVKVAIGAIITVLVLPDCLFVWLYFNFGLFWAVWRRFPVVCSLLIFITELQCCLVNNYL